MIGRDPRSLREPMMVVRFPQALDYRRFTVDEYHGMIDRGILTEDHPLELIDGEVVYKADRRLPHLLGTAIIERYPFTADEHRRLLEAGIVTPDDRLELGDGDRREWMTIGDLHCACVIRLQNVLPPIVGSNILVSSQNPIALEGYEPEPDISLLHFRPDYYASGKPTVADVLLFIEVADTTFYYDRDVKGPRYARNRIIEYWIVNVNDDTVHVFRDPKPDGAWGSTQQLTGAAALTIAALPGISLSVNDILP
jgi:Uma2 family endonuclease